MEGTYQRRQPETEAYGQVVRAHARTFVDTIEEAGGRLPSYVETGLERFARCGILAHGFLRVGCKECRHEKLVAFSCKVRGLCPSCGAKRMAAQTEHLVDEVLPDVPIRQWVLSVPFPMRPVLAAVRPLQSKVLKIFIEEIFSYYRTKGEARFDAPCGAISVTQRFGSSLNLHVHFHVLAFDGVYHREADGLQFEAVPAPTHEELVRVSGRVADRVFGHLVRTGMWDTVTKTFDIESPEELYANKPAKYGWLLTDGNAVEAHPTQTTPAKSSAEVQGFSVHAGVTVDAYDADGRERLCRYVTRPAFATEQIGETADGRIAFRLPRPRRSGETHVFFTPMQFLRRVTFQVPPLGQNLLRYHGVLAPAARDRAQVVRTSPPKRRASTSESTTGEPSSWARLLSRVYELDVFKCERCGGRMRIIAAIEHPRAIRKILEHLQLPTDSFGLAPSRAQRVEYAFAYD